MPTISFSTLDQLVCGAMVKSPPGFSFFAFLRCRKPSKTASSPARNAARIRKRRRIQEKVFRRGIKEGQRKNRAIRIRLTSRPLKIQWDMCAQNRHRTMGVVNPKAPQSLSWRKCTMSLGTNSTDRVRCIAVRLEAFRYKIS